MANDKLGTIEIKNQANDDRESVIHTLYVQDFAAIGFLGLRLA